MRGTEEKTLLLVGFKHAPMQSSSLTEKSQSVNDKWNLQYSAELEAYM